MVSCFILVDLTPCAGFSTYVGCIVLLELPLSGDTAVPHHRFRTPLVVYRKVTFYNYFKSMPW